MVLEGEPREREMWVVKNASLRFEMGGTVGLMQKAEIRGEEVGRVCEVSGGY